MQFQARCATAGSPIAWSACGGTSATRPALRLPCDADARFFVSLRCQVMIVVTGRLAIKRNAREASFQGVGRRRAVAGARGPARLRSRGRHLVYGHQRSGIRRARVNVVRSNAQMMGGVPSSPLCPLYLLRNALVPLSASAHASYGAARCFCKPRHPHSFALRISAQIAATYCGRANR